MEPESNANAFNLRYYVFVYSSLNRRGGLGDVYAMCESRSDAVLIAQNYSDRDTVYVWDKDRSEVVWNKDHGDLCWKRENHPPITY